MDGPRIALVACGATKLRRRALAKDLYIGSLFRAARSYAEACCDHWYILSAKHGLVDPDTALEPYEQSLAAMPCLQREAWGARVLRQLGAAWGTVQDVRWVLLAGSHYLGALRPGLVQVAGGHRLDIEADWAMLEVPLARLGIGLQLQWLKREVADHVR